MRYLDALIDPESELGSLLADRRYGPSKTFVAVAPPLPTGVLPDVDPSVLVLAPSDSPITEEFPIPDLLSAQEAFAEDRRLSEQRKDEADALQDSLRRESLTKRRRRLSSSLRSVTKAARTPSAATPKSWVGQVLSRAAKSLWSPRQTPTRAFDHGTWPPRAPMTANKRRKLVKKRLDAIVKESLEDVVPEPCDAAGPNSPVMSPFTSPTALLTSPAAPLTSPLFSPSNAAASSRQKQLLDSLTRSVVVDSIESILKENPSNRSSVATLASLEGYVRRRVDKVSAALESDPSRLSNHELASIASLASISGQTHVAKLAWSLASARDLSRGDLAQFSRALLLAGFTVVSLEVIVRLWDQNQSQSATVTGGVDPLLETLNQVLRQMDCIAWTGPGCRCHRCGEAVPLTFAMQQLGNVRIPPATPVRSKRHSEPATASPSFTIDCPSCMTPMVPRFAVKDDLCLSKDVLWVEVLAAPNLRAALESVARTDGPCSVHLAQLKDEHPNLFFSLVAWTAASLAPCGTNLGFLADPPDASWLIHSSDQEALADSALPIGSISESVVVLPRYVLEMLRSASAVLEDPSIRTITESPRKAIRKLSRALTATQLQVLQNRSRIKVVVRARPLKGSTAGVVIEPSVEDEWADTVRLVDPSELHIPEFQVDCALGVESSQEQVWGEMAAVVEHAVRGGNASILAYGQTGSGKTYTMGLDGVSSWANMGVIGRALAAWFERLSDGGLQGTPLTISAVEIHNESVHDLLRDKVEGRPPALSVRKLPDGSVEVPGSNQLPCYTVDEALLLISKASRLRAAADNGLNNVSSRSHAIVTVCHAAGAVDGTDRVLSGGKLVFADLAGSERLKRTKLHEQAGAGERLREATNINKSLSALGNVMQSLAKRDNSGAAASHIPYRDSLLTLLLSDSVGPTSACVLITTVSPDMEDLAETLRSMQFAERARMVRAGGARNTARSKMVKLKEAADEAHRRAEEATQRALKAEALVAALQKRLEQPHGRSLGSPLRRLGALVERGRGASSSESPTKALAETLMPRLPPMSPGSIAYLAATLVQGNRAVEEDVENVHESALADVPTPQAVAPPDPGLALSPRSMRTPKVRSKRGGDRFMYDLNGRRIRVPSDADVGDL
jgi:hypothetical protein